MNIIIAHGLAGVFAIAASITCYSLSSKFTLLEDNGAEAPIVATSKFKSGNGANCDWMAVAQVESELACFTSAVQSGGLGPPTSIDLQMQSSQLNFIADNKIEQCDEISQLNKSYEGVKHALLENQPLDIQYWVCPVQIDNGDNHV